MPFIRTCFFVTLLFFNLPQAQADYYQRGPIKKGEFIATFVEQVRHPRVSIGMFGPYMNGSYENGAYYYSGLIHKGAAARSAFGTTFWQDSMKAPVKILHTGELFYPLSSVSEGASSSAGGNIPFLRENAWYQIVYKIWQPRKGGNSLFGVWIQEVDKGIWHHALTAELPVKSRGFTGAGGFLEPLNKDPQVHRLDRRKSYALIHDQGWRSLHELSVQGGSPNVHNLRYWKIVNDDEAQVQEIHYGKKFDHLVPDYNVPHGKSVTFSFQQPEKPTFPKLKIQAASAQKLNTQMRVSWQMPAQSTPTIDARVELLNQTGEVIETHAIPRPYLSEICFTPKNPFVSLCLIVQDLYNQEASTLLSLQDLEDLQGQSPQLTAAAPLTPTQLASGIEFEYYAGGRRDFQNLEALENQASSNFGINAQINLDIHEGARRNTAFAAKYRGFLFAPKDGFYQIHLRASDGFRLQLAGKELLRDGQRGLVPEVLTLALKQGHHPLSLDYFNSRRNEGYLELEWLQPGATQPSPIAAEFLFHSPESKEPAPALQLTLDSSKAPTLSLSLQGKMPAGVREVRYFASGDLWKKTATAPFSIQGGAIAGKQQYSAKLYFENGRVWSTPAVEFESENTLENDTPWRHLAKDSSSPVSFTFGQQSLEFSARGTHEFRRRVEGDFTLKLQVNNLEGGSRRSSLALGKPDDRFALFYATSQGVSIPSHQRNFADDGYAAPATGAGEDPRAARWLCLAQKGNRLTSYYSFDGKLWHKANESYWNSPLNEITLRFDSALSEGEPFLKASLSQIEFKDEFDPSLEPKNRPVSLNLQESAILGLISGGEDIAYARTKAGLLKSEDFGQSWLEWKGTSLEKANGIIRSLAVSPHNPQLLLAAEIENGFSKLLKSGDGGQTWQQVNSPVSFEADNFSLLSGELIDFHPKDKNLLVVGGKEGLYLSQDQAQSWELQGLQNQSVRFARWHEAAITMKQGHALYAASAQENKLFAWFALRGNQQARQSSQAHEIALPAPVMDVRFQPAAYQSWYYVLTTRGIYETTNAGRKFMQMHAPDSAQLKQQNPGIFDHAITAVGMNRHPSPSTTQRMMIGFRMDNAQLQRPQATYLKNSFASNIPLKQGELVLKALAHPTDIQKSILGTDQGLYYTQGGRGGRGLYGGRFQAAERK